MCSLGVNFCFLEKENLVRERKPNFNLKKKIKTMILSTLVKFWNMAILALIYQPWPIKAFLNLIKRFWTTGAIFLFPVGEVEIWIFDPLGLHPWYFWFWTCEIFEIIATDFWFGIWDNNHCYSLPHQTKRLPNERVKIIQ